MKQITNGLRGRDKAKKAAQLQICKSDNGCRIWESEKLLYLEMKRQLSFIKPFHYEAKKANRFKERIVWSENVSYDEAEDCFTCVQDWKSPLREGTKLEKRTVHYHCIVPLRGLLSLPQEKYLLPSQIFRKSKEGKLQKIFQELRAISWENITAECGIYLRTNRSIQMDGTFALSKTDFGFRRFLTWGKANVRAELFSLPWLSS